MTYEEAIEIISSNICYNLLGCMDGFCKHTDEKPCAVQMAREALEKQIPKKPSGTLTISGISRYKSGNCGSAIVMAYKYCPSYGQAIDWSEGE